MITPWESIGEALLVDVPGCEWPMARLKLLEAAEEYFRRTMAWAEVCSPINTQRGLSSYNVIDVRDVDVVQVLDVKVAGRPLCPVTARDFRHRRDAWDDYGTPEIVTWMDDELWIYPTPAADGASLSATLVVTPIMTSKGLPKMVMLEHRQALLNGAKARLRESPGKSYTDPVGAATAGIAFKDAIDTQILAVEKSRMPVMPRTRPDWF